MFQSWEVCFDIPVSNDSFPVLGGEVQRIDARQFRKSRCAIISLMIDDVSRIIGKFRRWEKIGQ